MRQQFYFYCNSPLDLYLPTLTLPFRIPMVAGTTPLSLIIFSTDRAVLKSIVQLKFLLIYNYPWKMENNSQLVESLWFGCIICFILIHLYELVLMFKLFDFLVHASKLHHWVPDQSDIFMSFMVGFFKPNVAHSRLFGCGMPWVTIVDSKATTGFPWCNVFCTSSDISMTPVNSGKAFYF